MSKPDKPNNDSIKKLLQERRKHQQQSNPENLVSKLLKGDKKALAESITLIESENPDLQKAGQQIVIQCLPHASQSVRIGITGVPGVGTSTFIESFGSFLVNSGRKVAVLAVDPSSERSKGSILGDKTRMHRLSVHPDAFIRPTASSGSLGGVSRKTRETIILCEAAGFDTILVETVGVGQSEVAVHSMTDFFLLLMLAGAGDELQGIKRGIMEMADTILINKADGENIKRANLARAEYKNALHLFPPKENNWIPKVETISALEDKGNEKVVEILDSYFNQVKVNGHFDLKREKQHLHWLKETINEKILSSFYESDGIGELFSDLKQKIISGEITSYQAADRLYEFYQHGK